MKKKAPAPKVRKPRVKKVVPFDPSRICGDFQYYVNYDSNISRNCEESGCCGICRCGKIEDVRVTSINTTGIARSLCDTVRPKASPLLEYAVNRIITHSKACDTESWYIYKRGGYYGEEVGDITLVSSVAIEIGSALKKLVGAKDKDMIETALIAEYGYLLPSLENAKYTLEKVDAGAVRMPETYNGGVSGSRVRFYADKWPQHLPVAVLQDKGHGFRLIDGQHRFVAHQQKNVKKILAIVAR